MTVIAFDVTAFRGQLPAFANPSVYPTETLEMYWETASCFISTTDYGYLNGNCRRSALNLMVAHLATLNGMILAGTAPAMVNSSSVDRVSVSLTPPPFKDQFQWWLNLTAYGAQLYALLSIKAVGGFYTGGSLAREGFRQPAGNFLG